MKCRDRCGACCIAPSISSPIPGMPDGKPAGEPCVQLGKDYQCNLFNQPERPQVCVQLAASADLCGINRYEAMEIITQLELDTRPLDRTEITQKPLDI